MSKSLETIFRKKNNICDSLANKAITSVVWSNSPSEGDRQEKNTKDAACKLH